MRLSYILLLVIALALNAHGQSSVPLKAHYGPLKAGLLQSDIRATGLAHSASTLSMPAPLDSFFTKFMTTYRIPGMAACIVKKNKIAWQGYYGFANLAKNMPVSDSTAFLLASISKTVVATALMQLYEAGRFQLDDSVSKYLPFSVKNPNYPDVSITFRMLLTHTSSIQDNWNVLPTLGGDPTVPIGTYLRDYLTPGGQYYSTSLNFYPTIPGTKWNYSNVGTTLCAYLVETISGISFERYCRDSIFVPLHMTRTGWFLKELDTTLIARPYTYSLGSYVDNGLYGLPLYPAGQLRTTVPSLARFLMAYMNGGELDGSRILDSATVRLMHTRCVTGDPWEPFTGQGLMWWNEVLLGRQCWDHKGGFDGAVTSMYLSKENGTGFIFFTNFSQDTIPWITVQERLMAVADTLGGMTGNPKFDKGILLVNGVDFSTYGTEIRSAYLDKSFCGAYPISFWDCFPSVPSGGYPSNLPTPVGRGPFPLEVLSNYSTVIWIGNAYNGDQSVWNATPVLSYLQMGGNLILLTKSGWYFVNSALNDYLAITAAETNTTINATTSAYPGLTNLRTLGAQSVNDVFQTTLGNGESKLLFTATGSFTGTRGIGVWRKPAAGGAFKKSGGNFVFISGRNYRWNHADLQANMEFFLSKFMGEQATTGIEVAAGTPLVYALSQNYPNPFNPTTNLEFQIPHSGPVTLKIFDVLGRQISTLVNETRGPGTYMVRWDASSLSSGVYFYQLRAGDFLETKKMVLTR